MVEICNGTQCVEVHFVMLFVLQPLQADESDDCERIERTFKENLVKTQQKNMLSEDVSE